MCLRKSGLSGTSAALTATAWVIVFFCCLGQQLIHAALGDLFPLFGKANPNYLELHKRNNSGIQSPNFFFPPLDKYLLLQDDKQTAKVAAVQEANLTSSCQMIAVQAREHGTDKNGACEAM